jgi:hypothetical protein
MMILRSKTKTQATLSILGPLGRGDLYRLLPSLVGAEQWIDLVVYHLLAF